MRDSRLEIRVSRRERQILERAASAAGRSLSDTVRRAALREALVTINGDEEEQDVVEGTG